MGSSFIELAEAVSSEGSPSFLAAFDPLEELLWSATQDGMVLSHLLPSMEPYSAFALDRMRTPPLGIFPNPYGVIGLSHDCVHFFSKGGVPQAEVRLHELLGSMCGCLAPTTSTTLLAIATAFEAPALTLLDVQTGQVTSSRPFDSPASIARYEPRSSLVCLGCADGTLALFDVRTTAKPASKLHVFRGKANVICDFDVMNNSVAVSALRSQLGPYGQNEFVFEPNFRTFDLRTQRQGPDVFSMGGAMRLKWYAGTGSLLVASADGSLQILDARGAMTAPCEWFISAHGRGDQVASLDVSSSAQLVAVGDSGGGLSLSGVEGVEMYQANPYVQLPEMAEEMEYVQPQPLDEPVGHFMLPPLQEAEALASHWPANLLGRRGERFENAEAYVRSLPLPPMQQVGFGSISVGYFRNNINRPPNMTLPKLRLGAMGRMEHGGEANDEADRPERILPAEFEYLRKVIVHIGKFGHADDFSFEELNQTSALSTLDNTVPNCYCNVVLLSLYLLPWVKVYCLSSLMRSQFVLSDELGFLFHMMDQSRGSCCQPRNFQRALHQSREATALKLVDAVDIEGNVQGATSLPDIICKFCLFLLEQLNKEARDAQKEAIREANAKEAKERAQAEQRDRQILAGAATSSKPEKSKNIDELVAEAFAEKLALAGKSKPPPPAKDDAASKPGAPKPTVFDCLFGAVWDETSRFPGTKPEAKPVTREVRSLVLPITLPDGVAERGEAASFVDSMNHSICKESDTRAWCVEVGKYRHARQRKQLRNAPNVLWLLASALPAAVMEEWEAAHGGPWLPDEFYLTTPRARADAKPAHGEDEGAAEVEVKAEGEGQQAAKPDPTAVPESGDGATSTVPRLSLHEPEATDSVDCDVARYSLRALICFTQSSLSHASDGSGHLILFFRLPHNENGDIITSPSEMAEQFASGGVWYMWNDFALSQVTEQQVLTLHSQWKRPCTMLYARTDICEKLASLSLQPMSPVDSASQLADEFSLEEPKVSPPDRPLAFQPLNSQPGVKELPLRKGQLVAIDAEFVAVSQEVTRRSPKGKTVVVKPARLALARVSCIRGDGPLAGIPFIDSYIMQAEPVVDYLTRFSGLSPGDLDPSVSRHHIATMKGAYVKLRQLIDAGCIFIGHGLKKDFEMINVVIPQSQVLDTVDLFYLPGARRISLRFLAWHLLNIQMANRVQGTHDSTEDARTALAIYNKYVELEAQGVVEATIQQLYDIGRETHWEVPE